MSYGMWNHNTFNNDSYARFPTHIWRRRVPPQEQLTRRDTAWWKFSSFNVHVNGGTHRNMCMWKNIFAFLQLQCIANPSLLREQRYTAGGWAGMGGKYQTACLTCIQRALAAFFATSIRHNPLDNSVTLYNSSSSIQSSQAALKVTPTWTFLLEFKAVSTRPGAPVKIRIPLMMTQ